MTITRAINEIGIVLYRGVQAACVHGLTDLFGIAAAIASDQQRDGRSALRVTHWEAARRAAMPDFRASMTAIREASQSRVS